MQNTKTTYKNTELGPIPEDWEVKSIKEISPLQRGFDLPNRELVDGLYPVVYSNGIVNYHNKYQIKSPGIVTGRSGTIGKVTFVEENYWPHNTSLWVTNFCNNFPKYVYYLFLNLKIERFASGSGVPTLNRNDVHDFKMAIPPIEEQKAIATALSDTDALISSLEQLIAKKRAIKQGAMQELLKPKDGWEEKKLGEIANFRRGSFPQPYGLDKWYDDFKGAPFVQVYDVDDNFKLKSDTKRKISKAAQLMSVFIKKGSLIITLQGSIGRIAITQYDAYVDRTLLFFESFTRPFNKYFFMLTIYKLFEIEKEKAPGGIIKTITKEALSSFEIKFPIMDEQNRIGNFLSDMDTELENLERKLHKYKQIKQGMMQQLLTGKIRLV